MTAFSDKERRRIETAEAELATAAALAAPVILRQNESNRGHFELIAPRWQLSLYPAKQRIFRGGFNNAPVLDLPNPWSLTDVANELRRVEGR